MQQCENQTQKTRIFGDDLLDQMNQIRCRICYSNQKPLIAICECVELKQYMHSQCATNWIGKKIQRTQSLAIPKQICFKNFNVQLLLREGVISFFVLLKNLRRMKAIQFLKSILWLIRWRLKEGKVKNNAFLKVQMLNKVHNTKKLKLIKQTNNLDLIITTPQQKKQTKSETLITNNQKLPLRSHNTNRLPQIRFNYIPFLNKVRLDLHPIDKEIKYVHECIQNINKNLANIQTFVSVSQKIYSQESKSMLQNVAQSKIVQETSSKQEQLKEINKISLKQCFKVEMPQTHTEESQAKMSKQLIEKDSLHVLMEQFRAEGQNRLTQSYSQANYTVNINQAKAETLDPIYKVQKEESSLEIVNFPFDDTNGYIFKMQGTQLQAVSKLTIPQQQPQEQQSFQQGVQKVSKGQYVEQKHQKGGIYKGFMQNNKRNGLGTFIYLQGGYYEGNWKDNKMNGYGKIYYDSGVLAYEGLWYQDQIHGRGKLFNDSPQTMEEPFNYKNFQHQAYHIYQLSYEGDFSHDLKQGFGKLILSNGESYSGQFHQNDPHGKGFFNGLNCSVYGQWQNGKFIKTL